VTFLSLGLVLLVGVASIGLDDDLWSQARTVDGTLLSTGSMDVVFVDAVTDDTGLDPGYDKDVASCEAIIDSLGNVQITINNGYPSYTCRFTVTVQNTGTMPVQRTFPEIDGPDGGELTIWEDSPATCGALLPGSTEQETFAVHIEQHAQQNYTYDFRIQKRFYEMSPGTPGFWKNWNSHNMFTREQIEGWLAQIDATSKWFNFGSTISIEEDMIPILNHATGQGSQKDKFLAQYLALRLNGASGLQCTGTTHNVTLYDPYNKLGLANPTSTTLSEIIAAIEGKYGIPNNSPLFQIMKDICDAINNLFA
jgi:hypothetical protein